MDAEAGLDNQTVTISKRASSRQYQFAIGFIISLACLLAVGMFVKRDSIDHDYRNIDGIAVIGSGLRAADVQEIVRVANSMLEEPDDRVLSIRQTARDEVEVITGVLHGPLDGGGKIYLMQRTRSGWRIYQSTHWVS
jgi:hypothetical protein